MVLDYEALFVFPSDPCRRLLSLADAYQAVLGSGSFDGKCEQFTFGICLWIQPNISAA